MRKRACQISFWMTEEEKELLDQKIQSAGMNRQEYLIRAALGAPITNLDPLKDLFLELKRQGNHLNQIAGAQNDHLPVTDMEIRKALREVGAVWQLLKQEIQRHR